MQTNASVNTGAGQACTVGGKLGSVNFALEIQITPKFLARAPSRGTAEQPQTILSPQSDGQHLTIGREAQMGDGVGQAGNALHHGTTGAIEHINIVVGRPAAYRHQFAVGRDGCGKQPPVIARTNWRPQGPQQTAIGQVPNPSGFVFRGSHGKSALRIHVHRT